MPRIVACRSDDAARRRRAQESGDMTSDRPQQAPPRAMNSSQTMLDLIAVGYSFGLAAMVLYPGALGDRYGRQLMLLGLALAVPVCVLAALPRADSMAPWLDSEPRAGGNGVRLPSPTR
jgi:hypothetical protein